MQLGRVVGTVVSTAKESSLEGRKLLVVRNINLDAADTGAYVVAIDAVGAGVGEVVLVATGSSARLTEATKDRPSDAVIMAIVDSWDVEGVTKWRKGGA
ncbi:MAG: EutN/CcmL family microcompartment protein [Candidatus Hydrogenedentes bacterium]|nr:EutN/CcmL family microcompartment protein [Candidatus Hydrogenedentota bacterium]